MTSEAQELLRLIDGHIDMMIETLEITLDNPSDIAYY